jgi:hypothetical protein
MIIRRDGSDVLQRLAPSLAALGCIALSGCNDGYYRHHGSSPGRSFSLPTCPSAATPVRVVAIDTDAQLVTDAGKGAGVLVEYMNGGHWHISTVCDTAVSGYRCDFDVTAQVIGGKVTNLLSEQIESSDIATSYCADTAVLGVTTGADFDGLWFDTTPGATVRVTAALGQTLYENIFFWIHEGVVREDAAANPLELTPTAP